MNTKSTWNYQSNTVYFCGCVLDFETQTLQTESDFIRLRSKLWHVLAELVENPNKLIRRNALIDAIWDGNIYTGEQGLTHAICHLRGVLKSSRLDAKIVTIPKKGYMLRCSEENLRKHKPSLASRNDFVDDYKEHREKKSYLYYSIR